MENDRGDLADVVGASGSCCSGGNASNPAMDWQLPSGPINVPSEAEEPVNSFGDPFSNIQDPLLHELQLEGPVFFSGSDSTGLVKTNVEEERIFSQQILSDEMKRPCNVFSRMLQISPNANLPNLPHNTNFTAAAASTRGTKPPPFDTNDMIKTNNASCLVENSSMQIPLPRNPGIKRRKNQTKKVVCIPAPAAANNRSTGEVVPSDHWAWRKYGQKPIKGSPYPRGYYRCSSSKGCSARKQVERSRNDPNMLVITYTSEHNHPWPTQRNALAGSTRTQPVKKDAASKSSPSTETPKPRDLKEETEECDRDNTSAANEEPVIASGSSSTPLVTIKEEMKETEKSIMEMPNSQFDQDFGHHSVSNHSDDFFADLGALEPDPLELMFSQGFAEGKTEVQRENRDMDPFSIFDWSGNSFREAGKGL